MTDDTSEEQVNKPEKKEPENSPTKFSPVTETPATNTNQQTENMEVHHHPDLHHDKKKWKEYFLEFIMIFLAVTLGFFAETIREKISERHREKDYIEGLVNNIQTDTAALNGLINRNNTELRAIDTILKIPKQHFTNLPVQDSIYYYALQHTLSLHLFQFTDLTLVQLRNAGGYSLIKTGKVADSIALYESNNNEIRLQEKFVSDYYLQAWNSFKQVFDCNLAESFFDQYNATNKIPPGINVLITKEEEKIHVLYNNYWSYSIVLRSYNNMLKEHMAYLKTLIIFLKRSYNME